MDDHMAAELYTFVDNQELLFHTQLVQEFAIFRMHKIGHFLAESCKERKVLYGKNQDMRDYHKIMVCHICFGKNVQNC